MRFTAIIILFVIIFSSCVKDRVEKLVTPSGIISPGNKILIQYWNFNTVSTLLNPTYSIGGGEISVGGTFDDVTPGTSLNVRNSNDSASALRVRNPSTAMILSLPTTGYKEAVFSFSVMRSSSGAQSNVVSYTLDGTNYISSNLPTNVIIVTEIWTAYSIDFSAIQGANNNSNFKVKITFDLGNTATTGNDRYDNITLDALPI
jgi:hypothetical protein